LVEINLSNEFSNNILKTEEPTRVGTYTHNEPGKIFKKE